MSTATYGPNEAAVETFFAALEALTPAQLANAAATIPATEPDDWFDRWHAICEAARAVHRYEAFDAALDATWEHAAANPDYEEWDEVWEQACHTAAALVVRDAIPAADFRAVAAPMAAANIDL